MADYNDAFMRNRDPSVQARTKAQNRANVLQLKLIGQSHPTGLTTNLLRLFEPRPPLEYKPPPEKRKCPPLSGMAQFVNQFAEPGDPEYAPPVQKAETPAQKKARIQKLKLEKGTEVVAEELQKYDPNNDSNCTGDPYKTLFVARLNYETTEHRIKREFESYGPIKRVRLITDRKTNKPRGYAFIEYMHTRDMKNAYKQADGRKLDSRRVLVDVERGRTVPNWKPRRLGGGLGSTRVGGEEVNQKHSGREPQQGSGASRSEDSRVRDDRHVEREKSRERGREREGEKSRERDSREERHHHHRDHDIKSRDREREKERDRGRVRDREREEDYDRDHVRERERERPSKDRERDYLPSHGRREHNHHEQLRIQELYDDVVGPDRDVGRSSSKRREYGYYTDADPYDKFPGDEAYRNRMDREDDAPEEGEQFEEHDYGYHHSGRVQK